MGTGVQLDDPDVASLQITGVPWTWLPSQTLVQRTGCDVPTPTCPRQMLPVHVCSVNKRKLLQRVDPVGSWRVILSTSASRLASASSTTVASGRGRIRSRRGCRCRPMVPSSVGASSWGESAPQSFRCDVGQANDAGLALGGGRLSLKGGIYESFQAHQAVSHGAAYLVAAGLLPGAPRCRRCGRLHPRRAAACSGPRSRPGSGPDRRADGTT